MSLEGGAYEGAAGRGSNGVTMKGYGKQRRRAGSRHKKGRALVIAFWIAVKAVVGHVFALVA